MAQKAVDIAYCYACLQFHATHEHRPIVKLPFKIALWIVKVWWYGSKAMGIAVGWVVLAGWTVLFLGMAYYFFLYVIGIKF